MIEELCKGDRDKERAIFRFISRNSAKSTHKLTEEELLQEIIDELKDCLEKDLQVQIDPGREKDFNFKYPRFVEKVRELAKLLVKSASGYRRICSLPSFALSLVSASRIPSHYTHAPWFKLVHLTEMVGVYGTVSVLVRSLLQF